MCPERVEAPASSSLLTPCVAGAAGSVMHGWQAGRPDAHEVRTIRDDSPPVEGDQRERVGARDGHRVAVGASVVDVGDDGIRWWTWAGGRGNATLAAALPRLIDENGRIDNHSLQLQVNGQSNVATTGQDGSMIIKRGWRDCSDATARSPG